MIQGAMGINSDILRRFVLLNKKGHLAHAYLFTGPAHIGKGITAMAVAQFLNCEQKKDAEGYSCGQCLSCRKIISGNHPDIHVLEAALGQMIKIDEIRELLAQIRLRPFMAERKIFIVHQVENLTTEAANAFLKTLEEPTASSLLILTSAVPERVPETIISRCHVMIFTSLSQRELAVKLGEGTTGQSHFLAYFSEGCLGKAQLFKENGIEQERDKIINCFILGNQREALIKEVTADKEKTKVFLSILLSWIRDCILVKAGVEDYRIMNVDRIQDIRQFARRFLFEDLDALYADIVHSCRLLIENFNVKISLMIIMEKLSRD